VGIAQWQIEMAARRAPAVAGIVGNSTPVVSFGDPLRAEVATLGINPSRREFFSRDGVLLSGPSGGSPRRTRSVPCPVRR
jgi:hypothetical protein